MIRVVSEATGANIIPGIDLYASGRCVVRRYDGTELEKFVPTKDVSGLLTLFRHIGLFGLSSEEIERKVREAQLTPDGVWHLVTDCAYTGIIVRGDLEQIRLERYALEYEREWYPGVSELKVIQDAVDRVYMLTGESGL